MSEMSKLLSCALIVVDELDEMCIFLRSIFDTTEHTVIPHPCKYAVQAVSNESTVVIVQRIGCDDAILASFSTIAVRRIFVAVRDLHKAQTRATQAGGQVIESNVDDNGGSVCIIEGPEGIIIHIITHEGIKQQSVHEIIMDAMHPKNDPDDADSDDFSTETPISNTIRNPRPIIHTLDVSLVSNTHSRGYVPAPPNNRKPIPFETDIFKGSALLLVRTNPIDMHYRSFFEGKATFEVQVQGKFKRVPTGEIFVGADVTNKIELGIITRSFCRAILSFVGTMAQEIHYSFGDNPNAVNYEIPHLVAPLFKSMDRCIVTPAGQEPPPMGIPFYEELEARRRRMKTKLTNDWKIDTTSTYTFSVNTFNIDLCSWTVVGIPMLKPMDLSTFIGDSTLRLIGYELPAADAMEFPDKHPLKKLNYVFNLREGEAPILLSAMESEEEEPEQEQEQVESEEDVDVDGEGEGDENGDGDGDVSRRVSFIRDGIGGSGGDGDLELDNIEVEVETEVEVSEVGRSWQNRFKRLGRRDGLIRSNSSTIRNKSIGEEEKDAGSTGTGTGRLSMGKWFRRNTSVSNASERSIDSTSNNNSPIQHQHQLGNAFSIGTAIPESTEWATEEQALEAEESLIKYCPACIEASDPKHEFRRQLLFVLPYDNPQEQSLPMISFGTVAPLRLRTYAEIIRALPSEISSVPILRLRANSRFTQKELRRRHVAQMYKTLKMLCTSGSSSSPPSSVKAGAATSTSTSTCVDGSGHGSSHGMSNSNSAAVASTSTSIAIDTTRASNILSGLFGQITDSDRCFIANAMQRRSGVGLGRTSLERFEQEVALAIGRGQWSEEFMSVTGRDIIFKRSRRDAKRVNIKLPLSSILRVCPMTVDESPFEGFYFFEIQTFARVYHIMVRHERHVHEWIQIFATLIGPRISSAPNLRNQQVPILSEPEKAFVVRPSGWNLTKTRVLNCRKIIFRRSGIPKHLADMNVLTLVEHLLSK
eukprot:gene6775-13729_t